MRFRTLLSIVAPLAFAVGHLDAQDLQYQMTMRTVVPSMSMQMPSTSSTLYYKAGAIRIDSDIRMSEAGEGMTSTMIMDIPHRTMTMLDHANKQYLERPLPSFMPGDTTLAKVMSGVVPVINKTGKTGTAHGYQTQQVLMSMDMPTAMAAPLPGVTLPEGMKYIMVSEQWVATDSTLKEAYRTVSRSFNTSGADPLAKYIPTDMGFPLQSTMMMLQVPKSAAYDAAAIVAAGEKAPGLVMIMKMDVQDIKFGPLDASLFIVPATYVKR